MCLCAFWTDKSRVDFIQNAGTLRESEKKQIRKSLADGSIDMVIGTHALITDKTELKNLALAVTDEQHRFGVAQRAKLLGKGNNPHLLVMRACVPITISIEPSASDFLICFFRIPLVCLSADQP